MYIYIYIYTHTYIYIYIYVYTHMCVGHISLMFSIVRQYMVIIKPLCVW